MNPELPLSVRMRAAVAALPFERPKLAVIANVGEGLGERLEQALKAAIARSANADTYEPRRIIDHAPTTRRRV